MTHISQTQDGFKAKVLGILCGFQGLLTQNPAAFVEINDIFDFSAAPSIVFSIAHATIHSKCGVEQFVCPQSVLSVGAVRPGQPWHATNIQVHCELCLCAASDGAINQREKHHGNRCAS